MKVEGKPIKSVKLLTAFKGTGQLWMAGTVFEAKDGFPQDIKDEIGLNRIGVLNIQYEEPQSDIPETVSPKEDPVEGIEEVDEDGPEIRESEPMSDSPEIIQEDIPDKPEKKPRKLKKRVGK